MKIEIGISHNNKAMIIQEDNEVTGGFLEKLRELMVEYDVKAIRGGSIELTQSDGEFDLSVNNVVFTRTVPEDNKCGVNIKLEKIDFPASLDEIKNSLIESPVD